MPYLKDSDGRWHTFYDQTKGNSCGPACVRMVAKIILGKDVSEEVIRQYIEKKEGGKVSTITSAKSAAVPGTHNWGIDGPYGSGGGGYGTWSIDGALEALGINYSLDVGFPRNVLDRTTVRRPGIAVIRGAGSGVEHWVVVAGKLKNGSFLVFDPICGLKEAPSSGRPLHYTDSGAQAIFTGKIWLTH